MQNIQKNLLKIKDDIANGEKTHGRAPGSVTLVAVSKAQSIEKIKIAVASGQIHFGESYLQESLPKITTLATQKLIWHYIGRIQSNKTKQIAANFAWVEAVSSYKIAELLDKNRQSTMPPLNICIQVNISQEEGKAGVLVDEILPLAQKIMLLPKLKLRGLMAIPTRHTTFEKQFATFDSLALELKELQKYGIPVDTLSMGMSDDFAAAIAAGATNIRIGTAIFGTR